LKGEDSNPKAPFTTRLIRPILGLSKRIQDIVLRIPGIINGMRAKIINIFLNGVLVRSVTHAR
jgi:hypothetical protein